MSESVCVCVGPFPPHPASTHPAHSPSNLGCESGPVRAASELEEWADRVADEWQSMGQMGLGPMRPSPP